MGKPESLAVYLLLLILVPGYVFAGYSLPRENFQSLLLIYLGLFACYLLLLKFAESRQAGLLLGAAIVYRLVLIGMVPNLSDDFYRFIWDGKLLASGYNPYLYLPEAILQGSIADHAGLSASLLAQLNSPAYYSVYPPLNQFMFAFAAWLFPSGQLMNIVVLRCLIIAAEAGSLWLACKLLKSYGLPLKFVLIYALNPLVILELTGNLHFEALVIFFLLLTFWLLGKNQWKAAALAFAGAVSVKLLPLIFFPFLLRRLEGKQRFVFLLLSVIPVLLLFIPFWNTAMIGHIFSSIGLYFHTFEFNAGIYYQIREIGYLLNGFNVIGIAGPLLAGLTTLTILLISVRFPLKRAADDWSVLLLCLTVYLLLATTVHPWYISPLVMFCLFTPYRYPVAWSVVAILSYSAYQSPSYEENLWLILLEYAVLYAFILREIFFKIYRQREQNI